MMARSADRNSMASLLPKVVNHGLCAGCGVCETLAPPGAVRMELSKDGYLRPKVIAPLPTHGQEGFSMVCPGMRVSQMSHTPPRHPLWGPLLSVHTSYATDPQVRHSGSSGGFLSAIAIYLLESRSVDFVAQIAVSPSDPLRNELQLSRTSTDVLRAAGSRYSPSAPLRRLGELLQSGERLAFIGKPCDIAALRQYAVMDPRVSEQVLYSLSFMCAGTPSLQGTQEILDQMGLNESDVRSFQYRGSGWPGKTRAVTGTGTVREMDYNRSWGGTLNRHLQFRCKICPDATGEFADLVGGDAWYGDNNGYPSFEEREGRSIVICRTERGQDLLARARSANAIKLTPLPVEDLASMQPYQVARKRFVLARLLATWLARGPKPYYWNLGLARAAAGARALAWFRNGWGTLRRAKGEAPWT